MLEALDISASGMIAQRVRMDTIAQNVASMDLTEDPSGAPGPYRRRFVVFEAGRDELGSAGVRAARVELDPAPFRKVHEPWHPRADADGNVEYPNVNLAVETVNMVSASRAYEANITAMEVTKAMMNATLRLLA